MDYQSLPNLNICISNMKQFFCSQIELLVIDSFAYDPPALHSVTESITMKFTQMRSSREYSNVRRAKCAVVKIKLMFIGHSGSNCSAFYL